MSDTVLYQLFGGIGGGIIILSLSISAFVLKYIQNYDFKFDYDNDIQVPIDVLPLNWENKGDKYDNNEAFGNSYMRKKFAIQNNNQWNINIKKNYGDVYIYKNIEIAQFHTYHYLRINIKNITHGNKVFFQQKFFNKNWDFIKETFQKPIINNGENIFECRTLLNNSNENVDKEQIGIYITGKDSEIKNIIIDEIYYGEKWNFYNINIFGCYKKTILYRKKNINN